MHAKVNANTFSSVPYLGFFVWGRDVNLAHFYRGLPYIQTGFLVGRFVFIPTQVASKTIKKTNHTYAFYFLKIAMIYYGINTLFSFPDWGNCSHPSYSTGSQ